MPFPFVLAAIAVFVASAAVVALVVICWDDIVNWFHARRNLVEADKDKLGFTLQERLKAGKFRVVQGVFNRRTNTVVDGRVVEADDMDRKLKQVHSVEDLVIYPS